jgi:outer membrane lipopolysaccharide assembly protein LptE/RlpB
MLKKILIPILLLFLTTCGYEAMYSQKNIANHSFSISEMVLDGENNINIRIKSKLNNYTLVEKDKQFILKIKSSMEKITLAKNIAGDATNYRSTLKLGVQVVLENNLVNNLEIIESFDYDSIENTFDLKRYEKEIQNTLANTAIDKLIFKLTNIQ